MFKPKGVYAAMLTPFTEEGLVNEPVLRQLVDFMIDKGLHGLFPVSSVGEFVHMSLEQCYEIMEIVVDQARGRVPVTPGVTASCAENSIKLVRKAEELGCEGVVMCPPYFYPISQENMERHFEVVADSTSLPVILYNIPLFSVPISNAVVARLSRRTNVVGMKDSSGNMVDFMHFMDTVKEVKGDMNFLVGREEMLAPSLFVGGSGCMTACSGIIPEVMVGIWDAFHAGDYRKANRLQAAMLPLIRTMFTVAFPVGFKAALELRGFVMGPSKQPLADAEMGQVANVKEKLEVILADLQKVADEEGIAYS